MNRSKYEAVIYNAVDPNIFNKIDRKKFNKDEIKIIATSWSPNWAKGFDIYKYLDVHLDFSKYKMAFVGNSPIKFKNIKWIKPVPSKKIAVLLKENDIYITASKNDPCSNSLIEALSCGLAVVALGDGGHPELIQKGGELFEGKKDVIKMIQKVVKNYNSYLSKIPFFLIKKTAQEYYQFAGKIYQDKQKNNYKPRRVNFGSKLNFYKMKAMLLKRKIF